VVGLAGGTRGVRKDPDGPGDVDDDGVELDGFWADGTETDVDDPEAGAI